MSKVNIHKELIEGPVNPQRIADSIAAHSVKTGIGAHSIFLGQVRADEKEGKRVLAIDYSCYEEMAEQAFETIREEAFATFELKCMHIMHSKGMVKAGEISLFVFVSSVHRKEAMKACDFIVDEIKNKVPIWGKEIWEDESYSWKKNQ